MKVNLPPLSPELRKLLLVLMQGPHCCYPDCPCKEWLHILQKGA